MKDKIYTIPLTDAFKESTDCPFCFIYDRLEKDAIDFVMGTSYMQDDVREKTNELGFCQKHMGQMYLQGNRLGLALMLQTHIAKVRKDMETAHKKSGPSKKSLFGKSTEASPFVKEAKRIASTCFVCDKVEHVFYRYVDTFFYLLSTEPDFKKLYQQKTNFCFHHVAELYVLADEHMKENESSAFKDQLIKDTIASLSTLEEDLDWFVKKFDYRFKDEPWKNAKDAVVRGVKTVASLTVSQ